MTRFVTSKLTDIQVFCLLIEIDPKTRIWNLPIFIFSNTGSNIKNIEQHRLFLLCSLLYRGDGQVQLQYCRATLSVLSFHSFLSAAPSHLSCGFLNCGLSLSFITYMCYKPYPVALGMCLHAVCLNCSSFCRNLNHLYHKDVLGNMETVFFFRSILTRH